MTFSEQDAPKCVELGWRCILLAVERYGAWDPEASKAFSQVATRLAIRGNTPKAKVVAELYGRRSYPQTPQQENELITYLFCVFVFIHAFIYSNNNNTS